jgi:hypothetical protein
MTRTDRRRVLAALVIPLASFIFLRRVLGNATGALAVSDGLPLVWVALIAIVRRRLDQIALIPAAVFAVALALSITFGGSALPLELRRSVFPGLVGVACLVSVLIGHPLLAVAARRLAQARPERKRRFALDPTRAHRALTVLTVIVGITRLIDAAAQATLAFTVSATTFGELARVASYVIIGVGLGVCAAYLHFVRRMHPPHA